MTRLRAMDERTEAVEIEFTDRYGGRMPSWLRACLRCEAMGCYPVIPLTDAGGFDESVSADDWEFRLCEACHGTARVSWWRTATRVPRWLVRGIPFVWRYGIRRSFDPSRTIPASIALAVRCAYLADLGLWRP